MLESVDEPLSSAVAVAQIDSPAQLAVHAPMFVRRALMELARGHRFQTLGAPLSRESMNGT